MNNAFFVALVVVCLVIIFGPLALVVIKGFAWLCGVDIFSFITRERALLSFAWAVGWPMLIAGMGS